MAFDQNAIPTGLRPLNVARTLVEDSHLTPIANTGRNHQRVTPLHPCDIANADTLPVPCKGNVSDMGLVELGYRNLVAGVTAWCPRMPPPLAHTATVPAVGLGYVMSNRGGANAIELASSCITVGPNHNTNLGHRVGGGGVEFVSSNMSMGSGDSTNLCNKVTGNDEQISSDSTSGFSSHLRSPVGGNGGNAVDQVSEEGGDGSISKKKVKFMCSFGGKIFPRPSDGMLRYIGGQTRIISVRRDVTFNELERKMADTCGQAVVIKYQLPDEDLDALISVSCPDDLDNMMDEYEKLVERSSDGSAKLRMFLFSASELDSSGMVQFGDLHDSGQRYVETVNGIFDGVSGRITRKESCASATSTQNCDLSGTEAMDIPNNDLGVVSGPPSTTLPLPGGNLGTAVAIGPGLVKVDPVSAVLLDASAVPSSIPVVNPVPPGASFQPETELGRSVPVTLMQQQPGVELSPPVSCLQPTGDPRQAACVDFIQFRPQLGFPNSHHIGASGSVFIQQPNTLGITPHQFVPAVHMTMAPSSLPSIMPNAYQSLVQYPQSQTECFSNPSTFGPRVVQLSAEQGYNSVQVPAPPVSVGVGFGLHQVPWSDQTVTSDELASHHQATFPEKIERLDDCYFCQKAMPHAHSNSSLQDQSDNLVNPVTDSKFSYYSHHPEDHLTAHPMKNVTETVALGQSTIEHGVGVQTRIFNPTDPEVEKPSVEAISFPQHLEDRHENENTLKDQCNHDPARISAPQGALGRQGDFQSPHVAVVEQIPQCGEIDTLQHHHVAVENQFHPNLVVDRHNICFSAAPFLASEYNTHDNPKEYSNSHPDIIPNQNATHTGIQHDHLRPIVGNLESLSICPPDICANLDHCKSPIERTRKEDNFGNCLQPVSEREVLLDNNFVKPMTFLDPNHIKSTTFACSSLEVPYLMNERPVESSEVTQPSVGGSPGTLPQTEKGIQYLESNEVCHSRNLHLFDMKTEQRNNEIPVSAEWKDPSLFESRIVSGDVESVSLPIRTGNVEDTANSLFSNQDPWNLQHDTHLLPPRPNKIQPRNEALATREPLTETPFRNVGELNVETLLDDGVCHSLVNSNKGSSEEQIRKDLQAVAEGVAASVLQSAQSSNSELNERISSVCETSTERDVQNNDVDGRTRHSDKANIGFPMSEGLGRLQVIKNSDLEELRELGSGTFGTVYHGKWRGTDVAIKRVNDRCFAGKPSEQDRMREDFWNEAIKLADLHHPNVVAFYGVVLDGPGGSVATVTEYMVNGSLRNALLKNEKSLDKRKRLLIAMDAAFGMEYLHRKNIVHFDLKSDNLLVNLRDPHRPICKVGDLGLSKVKRQTLISGGVRGTLPWMAPELLNGSSNMVSEKVDVFSFGIVLWELLTGEEPYANLHYGVIIGGIVSNTLRPEVPESCDPEWRSLMERCWSSEPLERPSFTDIASELRSMAAKVPSKVPN
ncbi:PB1 domain-containing protein/Pkinase_Tyr domain-containing protein [Cucumis melo var. makuwa]|uniref:PB1 domain-containing protein/Pkinase_Tyr domain-containing protein n=1 Tax=Cucumis melo var. makuwa TaxID=1194695 RepID=A0A5D3BXS4_CUCMM|nr:PB1 domain-containing protein/Pkinase_Tyr domain-containing protein [Cucumis melo var. makuwa]